MSGIEDLARIVGKQRVGTDVEVCKGYKDDMSFVSGHVPQCMVRPRTAKDVQKVVQLANEKGLGLIPCSSGGPHHRGDTVPQVENAVIVDLSEMDSIVRIDTRNKVAMIEPGVCFGALQDAAAQEGLRVVMPLMPRGAKSVIASLLEREPTTIPKYHWDMSDPLCCVEVIFGTGDLFRTGGAAGPGTLEQQWASGQAQKSPMGPSQSDLARIIQGSQGTMGIVTWATVKLELLPTIEKPFLVGGETLHELIEFAYGIVRPRLPDLCLILNRADLCAIVGEDSARCLAPWVLLYSISGYEHYPQERVDYLEKDVGDIARTAGVTPRHHLHGLGAGSVLSLVISPSAEPYWKERPCGAFQDIFFLTTLDRTPEFVETMIAEASNYGLARERLGVYVQPIHQGRACHVEFTLMYDPKDAGQTEVVKALFHAASRSLLDMGGFFSRPYGPWSDLAYQRCQDTVTALRKVKAILDPNGVMNPGKLCFMREV